MKTIYEPFFRIVFFSIINTKHYENHYFIYHYILTIYYPFINHVLTIY